MEILATSVIERGAWRGSLVIPCASGEIIVTAAVPLAAISALRSALVERAGAVEVVGGDGVEIVGWEWGAAESVGLDLSALGDTARSVADRIMPGAGAIYDALSRLAGGYDPEAAHRSATAAAAERQRQYGSDNARNRMRILDFLGLSGEIPVDRARERFAHGLRQNWRGADHEEIRRMQAVLPQSGTVLASDLSALIDPRAAAREAAELAQVRGARGRAITGAAPAPRRRRVAPRGAQRVLSQLAQGETVAPDATLARQLGAQELLARSQPVAELAAARAAAPIAPAAVLADANAGALAGDAAARRYLAAADEDDGAALARMLLGG